MTDKPTPEQIQRACDLLNAASGIPNNYNPRHYGVNPDFTALADTIAKLDAMQADRDKARADLGEIYIQLDGVSGLHRLADDSRQAIEAAHDLAAPYRVETDPNEQAFAAILQAAYGRPGGYVSTIDEWKAACNFSAGVAELAKRGLEIGRAA